MEIWVPVKALRAYFEENIAFAIAYFNVLKNNTFHGCLSEGMTQKNLKIGLHPYLEKAAIYKPDLE
jgi:hypothetical protein